MSGAAILTIAMLAISLILAGAMAVAWASFGRPRHALSWSIAYLLYAVEIGCSIVTVLIPATAPTIWRIELPFILAPAAMVVIGARQRAGLPSLFRPLAIAVAAVTAGVILIDLLPADTRFLSATGSLFAALLMPAAVSAVWPRGRAPEPAEWVTAIVLALFALFEMLLVVTGTAALSHPAFTTIYRATYLIGLMPMFTATGVAVILLLASDLAARLRTLAGNDPLTGTLNRRGFHDAAMRAIANGRRQRQAIAIAIADIDLFKSINDRYGHTAGDRTLAFIAACLGRGLRQEDLVGRIGGEEFALLLVNSSAEQAAEAMERIRIEIATGFSEDGAPVPVTASFGVAAVPTAGAAIEHILADALDAADRALYRSKVEGRNRTTLAA